MNLSQYAEPKEIKTWRDVIISYLYNEKRWNLCDKWFNNNFPTVLVPLIKNYLLPHENLSDIVWFSVGTSMGSDSIPNNDDYHLKKSFTIIQKNNLFYVVLKLDQVVDIYENDLDDNIVNLYIDGVCKENGNEGYAKEGYALYVTDIDYSMLDWTTYITTLLSEEKDYYTIYFCHTMDKIIISHVEFEINPFYFSRN